MHTLLSNITLLVLFSPVFYLIHPAISLIDEFFLLVLSLIWSLTVIYKLPGLRLSLRTLLIFLYFVFCVFVYDFNFVSFLGILYLFKLPIILTAFLSLLPYADYSRILKIFFKRMVFFILFLNISYLLLMVIGVDLPVDQKYGEISRNMGFFPNAQRNSFVICFALIGISFFLKSKISFLSYAILALSNLLTFSKKDQIIHMLIFRGKLSLLMQVILSLPFIIVILYLTVVEYSKLDVTDTIRSLLWAIPISNFQLQQWLIGWGPGLWGGHVSTIFYSQLYFEYGLSQLWGASPEHSTFLSDGYWPHVLGEIGLIGVLTQIVVLFGIRRKITEISDVFHQYSMLAIFYLLIVYSLFMSSLEINIMLIPFCYVLSCCIKNRK